MNINLTLIVQMLVFAVLIWVTMKFVWPMILGAMEERARKIAAGLAAAEKGQQELAQAQRATRRRSSARRASAPRRSSTRRSTAPTRSSSRPRAPRRRKAQRLVAAAQQQIDLDTTRARESLRKEVAQLAVSAASKLLEREIDPRAHADLLGKLATQI